MRVAITLRFGGLVLASALIGGAVTVLHADDAYADQALAVMSLVRDGGCRACEVCREDLSGHSCADSGSGEPRTCLIHGCFDEGCNIHNSCLQSSIERRGGVNAIYAVVTRSDGSRLRDYVRTLGSSAVVNEDRRALQLQGCGGEVVASIPLSERQLASLTD
jgi:hypothetical protein